MAATGTEDSHHAHSRASEAQRRLLEEIVAGILLLIPAGFWIGVVAVRLCAKWNPAKQYIPSKYWTTFLQAVLSSVLVRLLMASLRCWVWTDDAAAAAQHEQHAMQPSGSSSVVGWLVQMYGLASQCQDDAASISDSTPHQYNLALRYVCCALRMLLLSVGMYFGESYMPICLTGGIACGKSTVTKMLCHNTNDTADAAAFAGSQVTIICADSISHEILLPSEELQQSVVASRAANSSDVDDKGPYIVKPHHSVYRKLLKAFEGHDILYDANDSDNGAVGDNDTANPKTSTQTAAPKLIDRRKLGAIVFADRSLRRRLNGITHPQILSVIFQNVLWNCFCTRHQNLTVVDIPLLYESGMLRHLFSGVVLCVAITDRDIQYRRLQARDPDISEQECLQRMDSQYPLDLKMRLSHFVVDNTSCTMSQLQDQVWKIRLELMDRLFGMTGYCLYHIMISLTFLMFGNAAYEYSCHET